MPKLIFIAIFLLTVFIANAQDARRFTVWNKNQVSMQPCEKITLDVAEKIHYSPKRNTIEYTYGEIFIGYEAKGWLEYGGGLRVAFTDLDAGNWLNENRWMLFLNLSNEIKTINFSFSNRFEYRTFKEFDNYFRHKQSLKISFPNFTTWGMGFYIAEESFYKLNQNIGTHLARLYSGLNAIEKDHFELKVYYGLEKIKIPNDWVSGDIVGLNLKFFI
jgi:hypothetical protein